jgi:hypothetical protein
MKDLFRVAAEVQSFIEEQGWQFCYIGGVALQRWGENRLTRDVDLSILTGFGHEEQFIDPLLRRFPGRRDDTKQFALEYRVLLLQSTDGIGIDISLAALPFERDIIQRSSLFTFLPDAALRTCSAEDLVVLKAFASRPQDWVDIRGVLVRQGDVFDRSVVREQLVILAELKEDPSILSALDEVYAQVS